MLTPTVVYTLTERGRGQKKAAALVAWREHCAVSPILKKTQTNGNLALFLQKHKTGSKRKPDTRSPISIIFKQFLAKILPNNRFYPKLMAWHPALYGKSWIRNCKNFVVNLPHILPGTPVADPEGARDDGPILSPNSFIFVQFSAKLLQNNRLARPPRESAILKSDSVRPSGWLASREFIGFQARFN